ncbi:hypothetical protein FKW77_007416 [Venturia effusa]|uniref:Uncharacterized protein n=1 Tax=Venturia effusa TaxID=50376 RepID=A0A517LHL5_9PEZI|nr:hypothetical protein FKW77_007416 [Venturia effusa]
MRLSILNALLGSFFYTLALARIQAPRADYTTVEPSWSLEVTPGGPRMNVSGTIQEAIAKVVEVNPSWEEQFNFTTDPIANFTTGATSNDTTTVKPVRFNLEFLGSQDPRSGTPFYSEPICTAGAFGAARYDAIIEGIKYLNGINHQASIPPGPQKCSRVSCSWGSAILWCNDQAAGLSFDSFERIVQGAWLVLNSCANAWPAHKIAGQAFNPDGWNVLVRDADC